MANTKTKMISVRLPAATIDAIQRRAARAGTTQSQALGALISDALNMKGKDGMEAKIAAMQAVIDEQDQIIRRKTGKPTPKTKRMSIGMTLAEAAQIDRAAHAAGMTRAEFLRRQIFAGSRGALKDGQQPALPA